MDNYKSVFFRQASPLLVVHSTINNSISDTILDGFSRYDLGSCVWDNAILKNRLLSLKYLIKIHRSDEAYADFESNSDGHLILSPFNPESDLYPNGILSDNWFNKYFDKKPFAVVVIFSDNDTLVERLRNMKALYAPYRIRLVVIIVGNPDDDRMTVLRQETNIAKADLFRLKDSADVLKDAESTVAMIASSLKTSASTFYSDIQHRIRQRHKKYYTLADGHAADTKVTLTPKFLETRNLIKEALINEFISPNNLEPTLTTFESAYQNLIELIDENFSSLTQDLSTHDEKLKLQLQTLTDTTAFHIVRGYISVEKPIVALKKHTAHIVNVSEVLGTQQNWLSNQYEWLAELLSIVPPTTLSLAMAPAKKTTKVPTLPFFGGFQFLDGEYYNVFSHPGMIYMKAASLLTEDSNLIHRAELLERALEYFKEQTNESGTHVGILQYLNWELAEAYERLLPKSGKALKFYEACFSYAGKESHWSGINSLLVSKLLSEYQAKNDQEKVYDTLIFASCMKDLTKLSPQLNQLAIDDVKVSQTHKLIEVEVLCFKDETSRAISVFEQLGTQLTITPRIDLNQLQKLANVKSALSLKATKITLKYKTTEGKGVLKNVSIIHEESAKQEVFILPELEAVDELLIGSADLYFNTAPKSQKIIQVFQPCQRSGTYVVEAVDVELIIVDSLGAKLFSQDMSIQVADTQTENLKHGLWHHAWIYSRDETRIAKKHSLRLHNDPPYMARVTPMKPKVAVSLHASELKSIVLGERIIVPFTISHQITGSTAVDYGQVSLAVKIDIVGEGGEKDNISVQANWDNLKDDEPLSLDDISGKDASKNHKLNISLSWRPNVPLPESNSYRISISMQTWVKDNEENGEMAIYDTAQFACPIISRPFRPQFSIFPRYQEEGRNDMPCPFVVLNGEGAPMSSMPLVSRLWQGSLRLTPIPEAFGGELPEVVRATYNIRTKNQEVNIDYVGDTDAESGLIRQLFASNCKSGSHRNVVVITTVTIEWKRSAQTRVNVFESEEWEITLPLSDPRVLLEVVQSSATCVKLKYIIENPTPRIFTFTTLLSPHETTDGTSWDMSDSRNMLPLEQAPFPVVPFNRHTMEYYCSCDNTEPVVDLPRMKVYDIHYKVFLPPLAVTSNARVVQKNLRWIKST